MVRVFQSKRNSTQRVREKTLLKKLRSAKGMWADRKDLPDFKRLRTEIGNRTQRPYTNLPRMRLPLRAK